jgi:hypothetical protein
MGHALIVYFVSGQVFKGSWRGAKVALKVLMTEDGVTPSSMSRLPIPSTPPIFTSDCTGYP